MNEKEKRMQHVITASKEIIELKRILRMLNFVVWQLKKLRLKIATIKQAESEIEERITGLKLFIAAQMKIVTKDIPFFPEITHFTQSEMDAGYSLTEIPMGDDKEAFDEDGDLTYKFLKYVLILHNGKVYPYQGNEKLAAREAKPV